VTLDDQANDGPASGGGTENVMSSVEHVIGTTAGDTLTGSPSANRLEGGGDDPTPGPVDRDGDRTSPPQDCDDGNAAIRPGATDRPGNRIDEDCSGADAAFPHVTSPIANTWVAGKRVTRVMRLDVLSVPPGGRVEVICRGRGCAFRTRTVQPRGTRARLGSLFGGRGLRVGTLVEIRVSLAPRGRAIAGDEQRPKEGDRERREGSVQHGLFPLLRCARWDG